MNWEKIVNTLSGGCFFLAGYETGKYGVAAYDFARIIIIEATG